MKGDIVIKVLEVKNLSKKYGKKIILENANFHILEGECVGILGPNGTGKSTLISILAGMEKADTVEIYFLGQAIEQKNRKDIAYVPQMPILFEELTVLENLLLWKKIYKIPKNTEVFQRVPDFLQLDRIKNETVANISQGLKKKVSIAIALMNEPKLLILDEAFAALDFETSEGFKAYLKSSKQMSCLFTSHIVGELEDLCDNFYTLKDYQLHR